MMTERQSKTEKTLHTGEFHQSLGTNNFDVLLLSLIIFLLGGCAHGTNDRLEQLEKAQAEMRRTSGIKMDALKTLERDISELKKAYSNIRVREYLENTISPVDFIRSGSLTQIIEGENVLDWADHEAVLKFYLNRLEELIERNNKNAVHNATIIIKLLKLNAATWENYSPYIHNVYDGSILSAPSRWQETSGYYFDILDKLPNDDLKINACLTGSAAPVESVRKRAAAAILDKNKGILKWADHDKVLRFYLNYLENPDPKNVGGVNHAILMMKHIDLNILKKYAARLDNIYVRFTNDKTWEKTSDLFFDTIIDKISEKDSNM
jgi:hypothetical protein